MGKTGKLRNLKSRNRRRSEPKKKSKKPKKKREGQIKNRRNRNLLFEGAKIKLILIKRYGEIVLENREGEKYLMKK